jgi:hypothetical protein
MLILPGVEASFREADHNRAAGQYQRRVVGRSVAPYAFRRVRFRAGRDNLAQANV